MSTFSDLGIDFPLFAADVSEASGWQPSGVCALCSEERAGFRIGIGDYVLTTCKACGADTPSPADGQSEMCASCQSSTGREQSLEQVHGCWKCLRIGRWASTVDTEAGMVTPIHAVAGRTHGMPFPPGSLAQSAWDRENITLSGWPTTEPNYDGWRSAIIPTEILTELVRTPGYITWQGEQWLFHCTQPMRYLGLWGRAAFDVAASDGNGRALAADVAALPESAWEALDEVAGQGAIMVYMFECIDCRELRGHWDCD